MQQETWQETSVALGIENDELKNKIFRLVTDIPKNQRRNRSNDIRDALLTCGLNDYEIDEFIDGNLSLGD